MEKGRIGVVCDKAKTMSKAPKERKVEVGNVVNFGRVGLVVSRGKNENSTAANALEPILDLLMWAQFARRIAVKGLPYFGWISFE